MVVLRILLGIAVIATSVYCIMFPSLGVTSLCWVIAAFLLMAGISAIVIYIESKNKEIMAKKVGIEYVGVGVGCLIFGIVSAIVAFKALSSPEGTAVLFKVISILFGLGIVAKGVIDTYFANIARQLCAPGWLAAMIFGILIILCGLFCIFNSFYSMIAMGTMVGMAMMVFGFTLILGPVEKSTAVVAKNEPVAKEKKK